MTYEGGRFWLDIAQFALTALVWLYVYVTTRHRVTVERIEDLERCMNRKVSEHADRLARVEEAAKSAPRHDDLGGLYTRIDGVNGQLQNVVGELRAMQGQLNLINEHLLRSS